jgi:hypothetical protein
MYSNFLILNKNQLYQKKIFAQISVIKQFLIDEQVQIISKHYIKVFNHQTQIKKKNSP